MSWVYIKTEDSYFEGERHRLWTVGHYAPDGRFHTDSDHDVRESAAERCNYLNGRKEEL